METPIGGSLSNTISVDGAGAVKNKYASRRVELRIRLP